MNRRDSYLRSATTSKASLEGVDRTVPGVDRDEPLFPAVDTKPASSGDEEPKIKEMFLEQGPCWKFQSMGAWDANFLFWQSYNAV